MGVHWDFRHTGAATSGDWEHGVGGVVDGTDGAKEEQMSRVFASLFVVIVGLALTIALIWVWNEVVACKDCGEVLTVFMMISLGAWVIGLGVSCGWLLNMIAEER